MSRSPWSVLGLEEGTDEREVRRAYARLIKLTRPEDDPAGFQAVREAYELALRYASPTIEAPQVAAMALPEPGDTCMKPAELARRAWDSVLHDSFSENPREQLVAAYSGPDLLNFEAREQFDGLAIEYAAQEQCPAEVRAAIIEVLGGDHGEFSDFARRAPHHIHEMLSRHIADEAFSLLKAEAGAESSRAKRALLADRVAPADLQGLWDADFMWDLRTTLDRIEWAYPELIEYKLNAEVLAFWQHQVQKNWYFAQTALLSLFAGVILFFIIKAGWPSAHGGIVFVAAESVTFGGIAWLAYARSALVRAVGDMAFTARTALAAMHRGARAAPAEIRFGWLGMFAWTWANLAVLDPAGWKVPVMTTLAVLSLALCLWFAAGALGWLRVLLAGWAGYALGTLMKFAGFTGYPLSAYVAAATTACLIGMHGMQEFLDDYLDEPQITRARWWWLAGAAAFLMLAANSYVDYEMVRVLLALGCLWGIMLMRFAGGPLVILLVLPVLYFITVAKQHPVRTAIFEAFLITIALFMLANVVKARRGKGQFA